ncbi:MAG: thiosulfohydrolase SoxB, partial [Betaproteobacteria bacterium]
MNRREFLQVLAAASAAGLELDASDGWAKGTGDAIYDVPPLGNVHLLHFTDSHAQLLPTYFREPSVNIGVRGASGKPPHLVGAALLKYFGIASRSREAYALTHLDFVQAAKRLWTRGQDMIDAAKLLGVDAMTGHWEFTLGADRVEYVVENDFRGRIEFLAQNVRTADFGDPVFTPYTMREQNGVPFAIVGQAFPYTPIANPRYFVPEWTFGIREEELQKAIDEVRGKGAQIVVLLSHNGMDVDLKLASRVTGIDVILGGHTHDGVPRPSIIANPRGKTLVTNAGCSGKFVAMLDMDVKGGTIADYQYRLLPVFSNMLPADAEMSALIERVRAPFEAKLAEKLAVTEGLLYRRGNFNGTLDQLLLDGLMAEKGAEIAFSPGFRWGTSLLPGEAITFEHLMNQTAITYPYVTLNELTGETIKAVLEDVADNLFNP